MPSDLFIAVLGGLGGMLGWGLADFFAKKTIDEIGDTVTLAWGHIFGTGVLILFALYKFFSAFEGSWRFPDAPTWAGLIFFGILQTAVYLLVYKGFGKGQIAVLNPIFASFSGITALLSIIFFGEIITGSLIFGLGVIFLGILVLNIDIQALRSKRISFARVPGFKEVGLATILAAFWTLGWDKFIGDHDWILYTVCMYMCMTAAILLYSHIQSISLRFNKQGIWKYLFLIGFCETAAYLSISLAYSRTDHTSVVALLSGAFSLPTIILARTFLKERTTLLQTVGSLVIIGGIIVVSLI